METVAQSNIELFGENLPSFEDVQTLTETVRSGESSLLAFNEQVEQNLSKTSPRNCLAVGIGLYILGRNSESLEKLTKGEDCMEKNMYLGFTQRKLGNFNEAIASLDKALEFKADPLLISLEKVATYRHNNDFEAAEKELKRNTNFENVSAEYHYQLGRLSEEQGLYDKAIENYKIALELAPDHQRALFHLAYRSDLQGDEEAAIDYYKQIVSTSPIYVNALMNLAVLYEDAEKYEKAETAINNVIENYPNHKRALMFRKDIRSSKTMFYDEEKEKKKSKRNQILETPISDFELSVRSRNCLRKMHILTLGDLLKITESELLSFKNFGETSLKEIKSILTMKNLRLGMAIEEQPTEEMEIAEEISEEDQHLLSKPIDDLQLSVRSRKCIEKLNIHTIGEISRKTEAELLGVKNFGVTSLNEIKKALTNIGLSLRTLD